MQCSFCGTQTHRYVYACVQHPSVTACQGCHDYRCNRCRSQLKRTQLQFCIGCKQHREENKMFGKKFQGFCLDCVWHAYKNNTQGRKVILTNHLYEPDKYDVYRFLKGFCVRCKVDIRAQKIGDVDSGLREIYPLDNNLCNKCSTDPYKQPLQTPTFRAQPTQNISNSRSQPSTTLSNSRSQTKITQVHQQKSSYQRSSQRSRQKVRPTASNIPNSPTYNEKSNVYQSTGTTSRYATTSNNYNSKTETPKQKWKRIQNSQYLKCMACGHLVLDDGTVTDDVVVCAYCIRKAKVEEQLRQSRQVVDDIQSRVRQQRSTTRKQKPQYTTYYQYPSVSTSTQRVPTSRPSTVYQRTTQPQSTTYRRQNQRQITLNNMPLGQDQLLVECSRCGIRLDLDAAGWEDKEHRALCRCCYLDDLEVERRLKQRYGNNNNGSTRKQYATTQQSRYRQQQQSRQQIRQPQQYQKQPQPQQQRTQNQSTPTKPPQSSPQPSQGSPNQPIIRQQKYEEQQRKRNKVKRSQSWDQSIVVQPVEDHERRKRERQRQRQKMMQDNINVIHEVNEEEVYIERRKSEKVVNVVNNDDNSSTTVNSSNNINVKKSDEPIQPIIIEDEESGKKKRIQSKLSWDDNIILEPIKKPQTSSPEVRQREQVIESKKQEVRKVYKEQEMEPIITQQEVKRRKVKKMESWDEAIVLEPIADHLKRKQQQQGQPSSTNANTNPQKQQQKTATTTTTTNTTPNTSTTTNTTTRRYEQTTKAREYSRSPLRQRQTKSPVRTTQRQTININRNIGNIQNQSRYVRQEEIRRQRVGGREDISKSRGGNAPESSQYYNNQFNDKYREVKEKLDRQMKVGMEKLINYNQERKGSLQNSRTSAYSRLEQSGAKTSLTNSRTTTPIEKPLSSPVYNSPYSSQASHATGFKNDDRSTLYSQSNSRLRQQPMYTPQYPEQYPYATTNSRYYTTRPQAYISSSGHYPSTTAHYPFERERVYTKTYEQPPPQSKYKDDLTGYRSLERKQRKFCEFCQTMFETTLRDYYVRGQNVCWECYAEYVKLTNNI